MPASDHRDIERFLLLMADVGRRVTDAIAGATGELDLTSNRAVLVLCALDLEGPMRPRSLSGLTGLSSAGTTGLLDRLEALGMISRAGGVPGDRRGVSIRLTAAGRRMVRKMTAAVDEHLPAMEILVKELGLLSDRRKQRP